jgi:hypothetical protein
MLFNTTALLVGLFGVIGGEYTVIVKLNKYDMLISAVRAICPINSTNYTVASQADADALNLCETFNGTIAIALQNSTNLISIPGVRLITGDLDVTTSDFAPNQVGMSIFSMESLASVGGLMNVRSISNLVTINLPALSSVGQSFGIFENPSLSAVILPNLTSVGTLDLHELRSLRYLNFETGLKNITGYTRGGPGIGFQYYPSQVVIQNTDLTSLEGLIFPDVGGLIINGNILENLTLSLEGFHCPHSLSSLDISRNYNLNLSLPNLTTLYCDDIVIGDVSALDISALTFINGSVWFRNLTLDIFNASNLLSVSQDLSFVMGNVAQINLPALQTVGGNFEVEDSPVIYIENGISMPNITNVTNMIITGESQPYCQILNNQRCRGLVKGYYSCGDDGVNIASDPNMCQYTYPAYGWTRAKKLEIGLGASLGPLALLAFICLLYYHVKQYRALAAAARALENVGIASAEQLPKYTQHDDSSGVVPPYEPGSLYETTSEGVSDGEADARSVGALEMTPNELDDNELAAYSTFPLKPTSYFRLTVGIGLFTF